MQSNYKITKEKAQDIINKYLDGIKPKVLAKEYDINISRIYYYLAHIPKNLVNENAVINSYVSGNSKEKIMSDFVIGRKKLIKILNQSKTFNRGKVKDLTLNHNAFDSITPETAYWIGIIASDGSLSKGNGNDYIISLTFKESDIKLIEKFVKFVATSNCIQFRKLTKAVSIKIHSKCIFEKLTSYGIVPNKSLTLKMPKEFKNNRDFMRGLIDGDGHLSSGRGKKNSYPIIELCGTLDIVESFLNWCQNYITTKSKVYTKENIFKMVLSHNNARRIIKELYENATIYLDRKYEIAKQVIEESNLNNV